MLIAELATGLEQYRDQVRERRRWRPLARVDSTGEEHPVPVRRAGVLSTDSDEIRGAILVAALGQIAHGADRAEAWVSRESDQLGVDLLGGR